MFASQFRPRACAALLLALALGCAAPGLPVGPTTGTVTRSALERAREFYLYPDRLDRRVMIGALDALEGRFDAVRFETQPDSDSGALTVGGDAVRVPLEDGVEADRFEIVLGGALHFVAQRLPDEANRDEASNLELIALRGALNALDRYTTVFSGRGTEDFQIRFSGKLHGIGAQIGRRDGHLTAVRVFPDSPAEKAGLKDGDAILQIDGTATRPLTVGEAVGKIRGEAGTPVRLGVLREEQTHEIEVIRGEVTIPSVETRKLEDGIGYARILNVSRTTAEEFRTKVLALGPLTGLVLDLRGNTGGSMTAAARLADFFLEEGVIVRIRNRDGDTSQGRAIARPGVLLGAQVVILVDPATASAAEILSGSIAPLTRVTLVGQTTFGKGLIQRVMPLPEENLLKLTVGEYLLSGDRAIHKKGIDPDVLLYPVSSENLGILAQAPDHALAYLRKPGEDDLFPVELATSLLNGSHDAALVGVQAEADEQIQRELLPYGITWRSPSALLEPLPEPLEISLVSSPLVGGQTAKVRVRVTNPNDFPIPDAWAALAGAASYLGNQIVALGTIPATGTAEGELEITPDDGLSVEALIAELRVASASHSLQTQRVILQIQPHSPELEIEVVRLAEDRAQVTLSNRGCCDPGFVRVLVPGALRTIEGLLPGEPQSVELPLTGKVEVISVLLSGAGMQRRIEIPLPAERVTVVPPAVELERASWLGRPQVRVRAQASGGLREGWLALDGQKALYVAWHGSADGFLSADLSGGDQNLTTKVETLNGVSVIDSRMVTAD